MRDDYFRLREVIATIPHFRAEQYCNNRDFNGKKIFTQVIKFTLANDESPFWIDILLYDYAGQNGSPDALWKQITKVRRDTESTLIAMEGSFKRSYWDEVVTDPDDRSQIDTIYSEGQKALPTIDEKKYIYRSIDSICGAWQRLFPCIKMMPFCQLEFGGEYFPAPKDYEWYLNLHFGDYLILPDDLGQMHTAFLGKRLHNAHSSLAFLKKVYTEDLVGEG